MGDFTALEVFRFFNQFGIVKVDAPRLRYVNPYLKKQYDQDASEMYEQSKSMYEDDPNLIGLNNGYTSKLNQRSFANTWRNISYAVAGVSATFFSVYFAFGKESK